MTPRVVYLHISDNGAKQAPNRLFVCTVFHTREHCYARAGKTATIPTTLQAARNAGIPPCMRCGDK